MEIYVVQPNDDIYLIADRYGVSVTKIMQDNDLNKPSDLVTGQSLIILNPSQTHIVQEGDTLNGIAETYGVSIMQLLRNNPYLADRTFIYPGENITISYDTNGNIITHGYAYPFITKKVLYKTLPYLTYLTIFNYTTADNARLINNFDDSEIIEAAKEYQTIPLMMVTTLSLRGEPDTQKAYNILLSEELQEITINDILYYLKLKGYRGINIVFNYMNVENQTIYNNFITKINNRLKGEGYLVFVTINTNIRNIDGEAVFEEIDYSIISSLVEGIIFLQFNWSTNEFPPDPVVSISDLRIYTEYALNSVSPDKIAIGSPVIGYDWQLPYIPGETYANSITLNSAVDLARDAETIIQFDELSQTPFYYYKQIILVPPKDHIVWFVDARTISALVNLISEYQLIGTGFWNSMTFYPQIWLVISSQIEILKFS